MATYAGGTRECARTAIAILLIGLVCAAPVQHQSASRAASSYSTDFSSYDSSNWSLENGCEHCDGHTGDECTAMTPDAVQFGQPGANIRTSRGGSCGSSSCTSGHLEWTQSVTFGVFKVRAKWFAGSSSDVDMASGFIGLFGGGDSITFIFHGAGWNDGSGANFRNTFQSEVYKSGQNHNKVNTGTGADFQGENDFELDWRPDSVTWRVNGQTVRTFNDRSKIPQGSMAVRLHSRAGYCSKMTDTAFHVHLLSFSYSPASIATEATIMPSIPPPNSDRCASHFDLSSWELDLPVSSGGGMKIIKQPQLISYSSDYFKMVSGACEFWAPINGGVSSHGGGPRSELRQNTEFGFSGQHTMNLVTSVLQVPQDSKKVVVGQIKGISQGLDGINDTAVASYNASGSCLITALIQYIDGSLQVGFIDNSCNRVSQHLGSYSLGELITLRLHTDGHQVSIQSDKGSASYDYSWVGSSYRQAFKAGVYDHGTGGSSSDGGRTRIHQLQTTHS